jgi:hypothetical protein
MASDAEHQIIGVQSVGMKFADDLRGTFESITLCCRPLFTLRGGTVQIARSRSNSDHCAGVTSLLLAAGIVNSSALALMLVRSRGDDFVGNPLLMGGIEGWRGRAMEGEIRYWQTHDLRDRTILSAAAALNSRAADTSIGCGAPPAFSRTALSSPNRTPSNRHASSVRADARVRDRWR